LALASVAKIEPGQPVMPTTLLAIEDGLDWPTGRSWDHLSRWGTEPLEKEESLPHLAAALWAEPRLDAEGQRLIASAYEGFASPPSVPDVLAVLTADRRLDEAGRALLATLFTSLVTSSNGHATDAVTVELVDA
jgi:hypothetical protein